MEIIRARDKYKDLFDSDTINKNLGFIVKNGEEIFKYVFHLNKTHAQLEYTNENYIEDVISEFKFYNGFVDKIYSRTGKVLAEFPQKEFIRKEILDLYPSQLYLNKRKIKNISKWIDNNIVCIPVKKVKGNYYILDGHSRLFVLLEKGINKVYIYEEECEDWIFKYIALCEKNKVFSINDLELLNNREYEEKWIKFNI
ncbi:hypothetical protein [Miniphocaeibacter halophilus]|uniref:Uncharacterized protein n=1 Tax=Miniphocaeibacter halophilus TaxID=2931922 RepID=A0AC61MWS6_9FIRM|nr:hypothetical protein [Miniphocaeibacter halophilus]QQK08505.1 hypothetical protein JFY71_02915 [Miniphocaeibacter halophilus]